jgi:hypothetical protein
MRTVVGFLGTIGAEEAIDLVGRDPKLDLVDCAQPIEVAYQCLSVDGVAGVSRKPLA